MAIPVAITALVERLNQELNEIEQEAIQGLNQAKNKLSRRDNTLLIQLFASLNNALLFVDTSRRQIQTTVDGISPTNVPMEVVQEAGEVATLLGKVLEGKMSVSRVITLIEKLP